MKSNNFNGFPQSKQQERRFSKALLSILSITVLIFLLLFFLLLYGINLFLSEPEPVASTHNQKAKIGFDINGGQFEFTFNERSLNDFSFEALISQNRGLLPSQYKSSIRQQTGPLQTNYCTATDIKTVSSSSNSDNPLKDLQIFIKNDKIIMIYPLKFGSSKKTVTIEETLKIEDGHVVSDIESLKLGKLPIPSFMIPLVLDKITPQIISRVYGNSQKGTSSAEHANQISSTLKDIEISKMLMPPTILVLFGPREPLLKLLENDEEKSEILRSLPTLRVTSATIKDEKLSVKGFPEGLSLLNLLELLRPLFE